MADTIENLQDEIQRLVDGYCYYRNLSIKLGAKPQQMYGRFDRDLCEKYGTELEDDQEHEVRDVWDENESLLQVVRRLKSNNPELVCMHCKATLSAHCTAHEVPCCPGECDAVEEPNAE